MNKFIVGILIFLALILFQVNLPAATVEVSIMSNLKFQTDPVMINVGDMVIWKNNDTSLSHTSTSGTGCIKDGTWDTGTINPGQSSQPIAFNSQGNYPYYCTFHCSFGMTGTVMVSGGTSTTTVTGGTTTTSGPSTTTTTPGGYNNHDFYYSVNYYNHYSQKRCNGKSVYLLFLYSTGDVQCSSYIFDRWNTYYFKV